MTPNPSTSTGSYAPVNGLELYYEVHGIGEPLVLIHGGMTSLNDFGMLLPTFAQTRQVIAYEQQGHGHTADIDRPLTLENLADDLAGLLDHLKIEQADVFGYSTGGSVALAFVLRHPGRVRKLVVASAIFSPDGYYPGIMEGLSHATADQMPSIMREMYEQVAPHPEDWPTLVQKSTSAAATFKGWSAEEIQSIRVPTLVLVGDQDIVRPEHAVELFRLIPDARLAVLPETDHIAILLQRADWLAPMITTFLDASDG
jgi:pimeloyl-ACP methyl ester carboxylesterase